MPLLVEGCEPLRRLDLDTSTVTNDSSLWYANLQGMLQKEEDTESYIVAAIDNLLHLKKKRKKLKNMFFDGVDISYYNGG